MGSAGSTKRRSKAATAAASADAAAKRTNALIDRQLGEDAELQLSIRKLLLLGGSESGKSTIAKQMRILHMNGFSEAERINFRSVIRRNIVDALMELLNGARSIGLHLSGHVEEKSVEFLLYAGKRQTNWEMHDEPSACQAMMELWRSEELQTAFSRRLEFRMADNAQGLLPRLADVLEADYLPTDADMLLCRMATTGVHEIKFDFNGCSFRYTAVVYGATLVYGSATCRLIDVGGQKSERRKWIHSFEGVTALLFVAALSSYDQQLAEDMDTNRLHDSVTLFGEIMSNAFLRRPSAVLFLNKTDLFEAKLTRTPLTLAYPDYDGPGDMAHAADFVKGKFVECLTDGRTPYTHFTNATDSQNVDVVFSVCLNTVLKQNITVLGI